MRKDAWDASLGPIYIAVVILVFVAALLVIGLAIGLVALVLWLVISAIIIAIRYMAYRIEAERQARQLLIDMGWAYEADDVLRTVFGDGVPFPTGGARNATEWAYGTFFAEEIEW